MKKYVICFKIDLGHTTKSQKVRGVAYILIFSVRGSTLDVIIWRPSYVWYINLQMTRVSYDSSLTLWGLEHHMLHLLTL